MDPSDCKNLANGVWLFNTLLIEFQIRRMSEEGAPTPGTLGADSPCPLSWRRTLATALARSNQL